MKKIILLMLLIFLSLNATNSLAQKDEPAYAKWGQIAVTQTIKKYPSASVVDYLHIGRVEKNETLAVEKFKLWLRDGTREFGVFVNVEFDKKTNEFKDISFRETDR